MKIKFAKSGINVFEKKREESQSDEPEPSGILNGQKPLTFQQFQDQWPNGRAITRASYFRHLKARDSAEKKRLDQHLNALAVGVATSRASSLVR